MTFSEGSVCYFWLYWLSCHMGAYFSNISKVRSSKFCWAAYSGQGSNITTFGKGFIMSTVGVEFPNIVCTIRPSSWRHLKKPWVIHLLCNYLKAYEAMIWVWSAKTTLRCLGAKFLEIFLDCFVCRGERHGFWSSALVMLDFCTVILNLDILI